MQPIRVLVVEDSLVIRSLLLDVLASDSELEIVGTANNGQEALLIIPRVSPDIITLDIEMPVMDGLETLDHLRHQYPKIPVVMFSTLTDHGARSTLDALVRGASDYCFKPANVGSLTESVDRVREELIPKIHALCSGRRGVEDRIEATGEDPTADQSAARGVDVVTISASTGGPKAIEQVLLGLAPNFPVPIVIVQHMPPLFTAHLASHLDRITPFSVDVATDDDQLRAGHIVVAPGDRHVEIAVLNDELAVRLTCAPPVNSSRPSADVLLSSVAETCATSSINVVLTGMGKDGAAGAERIVSAGGRVVVQDRTTSVVWGMPGAIAEANLAHRVLPLSVIPSFLMRSVAARCQ